MHHITEPRHRRSVDGDAMLIRPPELVGHDGDILLFAVNIAEGHADKLDLLLDNVLLNLFPRILHLRLPSAASVGDIHLLIGVVPLGGHHCERPGHQRLRIFANRSTSGRISHRSSSAAGCWAVCCGNWMADTSPRSTILPPCIPVQGKFPTMGRPSV